MFALFPTDCVNNLPCKQNDSEAFKRADDTSMDISLLWFVVLLLPNAISAYWGQEYIEGVAKAATSALELDTGCTLKIPDAVVKQREALGNPLMIYIDLQVVGVRDIPNQGGSFGIDIQ